MSQRDNQENTEEGVGSSEEPLSPKDAAEIRHDEPITGSGIVRSLFMANEPGQRMEIDGSKNDGVDQDS